QVRAGTGADLEHTPARLGQQRPTRSAELAVGPLGHLVDDPGLEVAAAHAPTAVSARRTSVRARSTLYAVPGSGVASSRAASPSSSQGIGATPARARRTSAPNRAAPTPTI